MLYKWNRIGAAFIDNALISIFTSVIIKIIMIVMPSLLIIKGQGEPMQLIYDILKITFILSLTIWSAILYEYLCQKIFGRTLGKGLLNLNVYQKQKKNEKLELKKVLKRTGYKYLYLIATFYLYGIYAIIKIILGGKELKHDKLVNSKVEI